MLLPLTSLQPIATQRVRWFARLAPFKINLEKRVTSCFSFVFEKLSKNLLLSPDQQSNTLPDGLKLFW